jgi:hypothetical protein
MKDCIVAHKYSSNHRAQLQKDKKCGCFFCLSIFDPGEIIQWVRDESGTAICPNCGVDSVIGESSGYRIIEEFLQQMRSYWFW